LYAYNSTISKKRKKETDFSEQVKGIGCLSAKTRRMFESLHDDSEETEFRYA